MPTDTVLRLFPPPCAEIPLHGLYLAHENHKATTSSGLPFLYTNFIQSLDGRISVPDPQSGLHVVPPAAANARDSGLFMELAAQADVLLTTSRHLRALAEGRHQEVFKIGADPRLAAWRQERGLTPQPAIAAVSERLMIPLDAVRAIYSGPILIITGTQVAASRVETFRAAGMEIAQLPSAPTLDGQALITALAEHGYRHIYSIVGPRVTHALLSVGVVSRLYLTFAQLALGGRDFDTLVRGDALMPPARFSLHQLHFDPGTPAGTGQLFASFDGVI